MKEKLLALLKSLGIEVTEAMKALIDKAENQAAIDGAFKIPEGLLNQEQIDKIIQERLKRAEKTHETEVKELQDKLKTLVDPAKITEMENTFKTQLAAANARIETTTKESKLLSALHLAGAKNTKFLMYEAGQRGLLGRFTVDDKGNITIVGADGKPAFGKDGKALEISHLVDELKNDADLKDSFTVAKVETPGATNPLGPDAKPGDWGASIAKKAAEASNTEAEIPAAWK